MMVKQNIKQNKIFSSIVAGAACVTLLATMVPFAYASAKESAVTSTRSFPKLTSVKRDLLTESTSTSVDSNSHWGGIESLNVPQTKSAEEVAAENARNAANAGDYDFAASRSGVRGMSQNYFVAPPDGSSVSSMLNFAAQFVDKVPYRSGGTTPAGWDCSGFVKYVFANMGISLPRTSGAQATVGTAVPSLDQAAPGDIIANGTHAAIYVGNGMVINSQYGGTKYSPIPYVFTSAYSIRRVF
ncbi:NlpC/P60 family protein [Gardnerella vaginalis]|uniref:NlpC/P60 family protein n=2 Tax=Gardnerella vaginalis TaxID=2702 RepID=A0A133NM68_GARVA|nr:C40 family peptidase [Gardnerella vaginalis]KXA17382.1 NlpC/P60 family protein [Gardnerella vaginalis]MDK7192735.1 C40 family peptidase [Bifidobacterium sp. UMB1197]